MLIRVKVKTKQKLTKLLLNDDGTYTAFIKSLPEKNQANFEILNLVANAFNVSKINVSIKSGMHSNIKSIYIDD